VIPDPFEVLREARARLTIPPKLIKVQDGKPIPAPAGGISILGGPDENTKVGDFAGYESIMSAGCWYGQNQQWLVCSMKWADSPAYAAAIAYRDKLDALLTLESRVILCEREKTAVIEATADGFARIFIPAETELEEGDTLHRPFRTDEEKSNG